jgi:pyruvate formate lyase activating enzyme
MKLGRIHSTESFGTVDGPGLRYVIFLQGCPMRCLYCHNPDTWSLSGGIEMSADELLCEYDKNAVFYKNGGLTVTGGEPLLQIDFLLELFEKAKEKGIHTCIDTSGITYDVSDAEYIEKLDRLLELTDLVMLDIKHIDPQKHKDLTGHDNQGIINFAKHLVSKNVAIWIRHVIVEGYTDDDNDLLRLGEFIGSLKQVKALDVIPYHTMGASKYKEMGIKYRLEGLGALSKESAMIAKQKILEGIRKTRR